MNHKLSSLFGFLTLVLSLAAVGCGPHTVPVSGKVTIDGKPAENIRVVFQSEGTTLEVAPVAIGLTDANGQYSLALAQKKKNGAVPGNYAVFLVWKDPDAEENPVEGVTEANECPYNLPSKANSGELRMEVPEGGTKDANFEFDSNEKGYSAPVGV